MRRTRRPSWAMLLLYHWGFVSVGIQLVEEEGRGIARTTSRSTDGAEVPLSVAQISNHRRWRTVGSTHHVIIKAAKYAT